MKPVMFIGIVLIVLGALVFIYQGISFTSHERIIDIGPIQASADIKKTIPLPPLLGGLMLAGGMVMVIAGRKKS